MTETALISACLQGEEQAQKQLYELYLPYVFSLVRRFGISEHDTKDVIQEVFIEIFVSLPRYRVQKGALKPWIKTVAIRKIVKFQRNRKNWKMLDFQEEQVSPGGQSVSMPVEWEKGPALALIRQLPDGFREIFNLNVIDGYSHQEIAKMLSISPGTSRSQLSRAKAILREKIRKSAYYDHL